MSTFTFQVSTELRNRLQQQSEAMPEALATRLHRAISWVQCAEEADSADVEFISLWISFSACCAIDQQGDQPLGDHDRFTAFIERLVNKDSHKKIHKCLWEEYSGHVKALIKNPYVFHAFWVAKREGSDAWKAEFDQSSLAALNALSRGRVAELCSIVLDRLFVLRNQLIYGGATFKGSVNREQVEDGAGLLATLMPIVIETMMDASQDDWGEVAYPVVND